MLTDLGRVSLRICLVWRSLLVR